MSKNFDLTYVFGAGRIERLNSISEQPDDFFYGYKYFEKKYRTKIIEMNFPSEKRSLKRYIDNVLRKLTKLPIYLDDIATYKNYKILKSSNKILFTSELLALSLLPFLLIIKMFRKVDVYIIVMGLFGRTTSNYINKLFQFLFIRLIIYISSNIFFLGKGEIKNIEQKWLKHKSKFIFLPFCIDFDFWKVDNDYSLQNRNQILFIGNDGKRDYKLAQDIASKLPEIEFTFITAQIENENLTTNNINLIKGKWNENYISDNLIKDFYSKSRITIVPLKESTQPSGQSVTLQSMAAKCPVLISKTVGFWDSDKFTNKSNIIFIEDNNLEGWVNVIKKTYENENYLKKLSHTGFNLVKDEYNLDKFNTKLDSIIFNE